MATGVFRAIHKELWRRRRNYGYELSCTHIYYTDHPIVGALEVPCEVCLARMRREVVAVMELPPERPVIRWDDPL